MQYGWNCGEAAFASRREFWCQSMEVDCNEYKRYCIYRYPTSAANIAEFAGAVLRTNEQVSELSAHHARLRKLHGWFLDYQRRNNVIGRTYCETREV